MWKIRFSDYAYNFNEYTDIASYQDEFVIKNNNLSWNTFLNNITKACIIMNLTA